MFTVYIPNWLLLYMVSGNLALSRALGDFVFKKNITKRPEEQIVTGKVVFYLYKMAIID